MARRVAIVPHTHWDREWYEPYQTFRLRLVDLLDDLLPKLESDPSYARFLLDGQVAMVDDYLEVRPEARETIRRLVSSGRVTMGPWYVLMDEFLVTGETLVRNLQMGLDRAASLGGAMRIGYLPDMFGHVAQMPQLLRLAGMEHAVVWRGVPLAVDRTAFWWSSPDGSMVRAEYLPCGYGNGASIPDDAKALVKRIAAHDEEIADLHPARMLFMNGTDHQRPQPWLGRVVAEANEIQDDYELVVTSLPEELPRSSTEGLPSWSGELRSGARANLLMGVTSNRMDVRRAAQRAARAVEERAEPMCALFLPPDRWPARLLDLAWREIVRNAAHDSICACSLDEVVDAVLNRFAEARQIGEGLAARAVSSLGASVAGAGPLVVNPSSRSRGGMIELIVPGEGSPEGTQALRTRRPPRDAVLGVDETRALLGAIREQQIGPHTFVNGVDIEEDRDGFIVTIRAGSEPASGVNVDEMRRDLYTRIGARPDAQVHLRFDQPPTRRFLARVNGIPGFGWARWTPSPLVNPVDVEKPAEGESGTGGLAMSNGLVRVAVDAVDGTFSMNGIAGFDRLVESGDAGDTYNYSPPDEDTVVASPEHVQVSVAEPGPVRGRLRVERSYTWPERYDPAARKRTGARDVVVSTVIELRADESLVRVHTTFENTCRDHRVRAHLPLPRPARSSRAECAFAVVERGLEAEGGPNERGLPTFPSRRFVQAGGLTVVHEGLSEYELVDVANAADTGVPEARTLALTLLRSTGMLSRNDMTYRPLPAGPAIALEGSQLLGPVEARYAIAFDGSPADVDPFALVDDAFLPLEVVQAPGGGTLPDTGSALEIAGAEVSAVRRQPGGLEVRMCNPTPAAATVTIVRRGGWLVDLLGLPVRPFQEELVLGPWAIATVLLSED